MMARLKEIKEINKLRESMDLRPISAGIIQCRRCEQDFFSEDITREKMCEQCKEAVNEFVSDNVAEGGAKQNKKWLM
jgi:predicted Zn-ribbon and HTH transcriptional regulator